jgi:phosphate/sulfate permease
MQDAANIAVYLPRSLDVSQFIGFAGVVFLGLGLLLYYKGGRIQKIVTEKSVVTDVRFATIIDFIYCIILFYFKLYSKVPMSTTWVFIGLLGGREVAMSLRKSGENNTLSAIKLLTKDFSYALIGLIISIAIAIGVNDQLTFSSMLVEIPKEFSAGITKFFGKLGF